MLSALILTLFLTIICRSIALIEYSNTIIDESLTLFENPFFLLEVSNWDYDRVVYLNIAKKIVNDDKLRLNIIAERFDGLQFPISDNHILLCDLLEEEAENQTSILSKLHFSRVFNMEGMHCPIPVRRRRLLPYMFPPHVTLENDIGCGDFDYQITIETCEDDTLQNCVPIISVDTIINMQTEHCSNANILA